jgi:hypothetical protein
MLGEQKAKVKNNLLLALHPHRQEKLFRHWCGVVWGWDPFETSAIPKKMGIRSFYAPPTGIDLPPLNTLLFNNIPAFNGQVPVFS